MVFSSIASEYTGLAGGYRYHRVLKKRNLPPVMIHDATLEETDILRPQFDKRGGLLPVVVQDYQSYQVLMVGYVNELALQQSLDRKMATFWSTSRNALWTKGETSGDYLRLHEARIDCDQDAVLFLVERMGGGVCHTKDATGHARSSCFYRRVNSDSRTLRFQDTLST